MPELSPAAQQVFWAFNRAASGKPDDWHYLPAIAAALEAAADQVVPLQAEHSRQRSATRRYVEQWTCWNLRQKLLAIAAELKAS